MSLTEDLQEVSAKVDALIKDRERLDWLATHEAQYENATIGDEPRWILWSDSLDVQDPVEAKSFREAIDAAMLRTKEEV